MSEKLWYLKNCRLFEVLTATELEKVEVASQAKMFARGNPIYLPAGESSAVYVLTSGRAKICHLTADGKQSILAFIEPGELFGELAIFEAGPRNEYAEALDKTTVVRIPVDVMQSLIERYPQVSLGVTKIFGLRRKRIEQRLKNLLFYSNRERMTHLLLEMVEQYGRQTVGGIDLRIRLSHQDLANAIGKHSPKGWRCRRREELISGAKR
jgi:CRP-like cAMP-binding protein